MVGPQILSAGLCYLARLWSATRLLLICAAASAGLFLQDSSPAGPVFPRPPLPTIVGARGNMDTCWWKAVFFSKKFPSDYEFEGSCSGQPGSLFLPSPPSSTVFACMWGWEGWSQGNEECPLPSHSSPVWCDSTKPGGCVGVPCCVWWVTVAGGSPVGWVTVCGSPGLCRMSDSCVVSCVV